jgi:hypothetical protein
LQQVIESSVPSEELRQEVLGMGKSMADMLMEKGRTEAAIETRQQTLLRQLRKRFDTIPPSVLRAVESTTDVQQLDQWLDGLVTAGTLDELEIPAPK